MLYNSLKNYEQVNTFFNVAGCIPGVKEVSGMTRMALGCQNAIRGIFYDFWHRNDPAVSLEEKQRIVVKTTDPIYSKFKQFLAENKEYSIRELLDAIPELDREERLYFPQTDAEYYENDAQIRKLDGALDISRGFMESRTARWVMKTNPISNYHMMNGRQIGSMMFNRVSMTRSIPACVLLFAMNVYLPKQSFAPIFESWICSQRITPEIHQTMEGDFVGRLL